MRYQIFSDMEWLYPDTPVTSAGGMTDFISARAADVCFQILTDGELSSGETVTATLGGIPAIATVYQLLPAHVGENSGEKEFTTTDYERVKDFVTRKAPFEVYEITAPLSNGATAGRAAFFVRLDVPADAEVGEFKGLFSLAIGAETLEIPVTLKICETQIPPLAKAALGQVHWIYYDALAEQYGVELWSEDYERILCSYLAHQLDMRTDHLMLPTAEPVRDADGHVVDFDFSHAEYVGNLALSMGFRYVMGGFVCRFKKWDEALVTLLWERDTDVTSIEGYRQLKLYFSRAWESVKKCGWEACYYQCLEDEPQFQNSAAYRAVSAICRKMCPGVRIHDPVESTELGGAVDIWVIKQALYEKYLKEYTALREMGEETWIYTCGFPAWKMMNHVLDLPLTATRLPTWMCFKHGATGFLHWGYHLHNPEGERETCYDVKRDGLRYPAGNSFVVYVGERGPVDSLRSHAQRGSAYDYELLMMLAQRDRTRALSLVDRLCRTFADYETDARVFDAVRRELLETLG